jgi:hypothetical protein
MSVYRLYGVGADDHFKSVKVVECASDADALAVAEKMIGHFAAIEVWEAGKRVGRVSAGPAPAPLRRRRATAPLRYESAARTGGLHGADWSARLVLQLTSLRP